MINIKDKLLKDCLPQSLLGPFLNTLSQLYVIKKLTKCESNGTPADILLEGNFVFTI